MQYLEEAFWRQQFFGSPQIRDACANSLANGMVLRLHELAELAVRQILEQYLTLGGDQIYSPEREYEVGQTLAFLGHDGVRLGTVVGIKEGRVTYVQSAPCCYDQIIVRFTNPNQFRPYASNCPGLPLRFSYDGSHPIDFPHARSLTPGQIVTRFSEVIIPSVKEALAADPRFCTFDGEDWMLGRFLVDFEERVTAGIIPKLRESGEMGAEKLAEAVRGTKEPSVQRASVVFSLSYHLTNDLLHRFASSRTQSGVSWALTPPPKQVVCTLDEEMTATGRVRLPRDFEKIVDYYGLTSALQIQAYGGYALEAIYDPDLRLISGNDVRLWIEENGLSPGHRIYIKSPSFLGAPLVLFSEHEIYQPPESSDSGKPPHSRLFLRHKIHAVLTQAQEWLHYREISERLAKSGFEVKCTSVIATLSANEHLFCRHEPARGLWGLTRWLGQPTNVPVNLQSLSITIREEQWVHTILREEGAPLSPKEIERRLSERFGVSTGTIRELTIIDGTDPAIDQLRDGRFLLCVWIGEWGERLKECDRILAQCRDLRGKISATKDSLSAYQKELQPIDRLMASQLAMENALAKKISTLRDDTGTAQSEYRSSSAGIGRLQSELVALEKQSQKVARWRTIGLASFLLVAVCLLIGAPTAVPVLAAVGSSGACLTIQRVLRSLRGKVQAKRKLLISTTARAVAAFTRLGRKQQELTVAENEYTAARNSRDRLTIEQQSLRLKVKESSATVSTIEAELGCYQEIRVVEERAHLLELLGACAEVEHGRRA